MQKNSESLAWMEKRHSVRCYDGKPLSEQNQQILKKWIDQVNHESSQHFQLAVNEPKAFSGLMARLGGYGRFNGVVNYIGLIGDNEERLGYYGEQRVEKCTELGLKTCWVGLNYNKIKGVFTIPAGSKLMGVIAVGTSDQNGVPHKMRTVIELSPDADQAPEWFREGVKGAILAPSAVNQQKYRFYWNNGKPEATKGMGFYTDMDLGIAKYHFNQAAGRPVFSV